MSAARMISKSPFTESRLSATATTTPFSSALARTASRERGAVSRAITSRAPDNAAAIAAIPEPEPTSRILMPEMSSGWSRIHLASTCPLDQQKAQNGASSISACLSSSVKVSCG